MAVTTDRTPVRALLASLREREAHFHARSMAERRGADPDSHARHAVYSHVVLDLAAALAQEQTTSATTDARPTDGSHLPVVHLNGSGRAALYAQYEAMHTALNAALEAFAAASPHGRDYYPKGDDAYTAACREFSRRAALLEGLRDDVMADWLDMSEYLTP